MKATPDTRVLHQTALRLGMQAAALVAVTVVVLVAVASLVVLHAQRSAGEILLSSTVGRADDVGDPPAGVWLTIARGQATRSTPGIPAGLPLATDITAVFRSGTSKERTVRVSTGEFRVVTRMRDDEVVQAALNLGAEHQERRRLLAALIVSGLLGLGMAIVIGSVLGRRAVRPLSDALELQRRFVADASHELRTPLTLLSTRAQLVERALGREGGSEGARLDAAGVVTDARHLADIVTDLLDAAHPGGELSSIDVLALLREVVDSSVDYGASREVRVVAELPPDRAAIVGQRPALRRAVTALVDNAIEHSPIGGAVRVGCSRQGGSVRITVADDGPGVPTAERAELFDRFHSGGGTSGRRRYGLGLALADEVVARHGGRLEVTAGQAAGSVFAIVVPARQRRARGR